MTISVLDMIINSIELSKDDFLADDPRYKRCLEIMSELEDKYMTSMSEQQKEILLEFYDAQTDMTVIMCDLYFKFGFKQGFRLALEVLGIDLHQVLNKIER